MHEHVTTLASYLISLHCLPTFSLSDYYNGCQTFVMSNVTQELVALSLDNPKDNKII